jgi:hypothetical protein
MPLVSSDNRRRDAPASVVAAATNPGKGRSWTLSLVIIYDRVTYFVTHVKSYNPLFKRVLDLMPELQINREASTFLSSHSGLIRLSHLVVIFERNDLH